MLEKSAKQICLALAFPATISQTTPNVRREGECRCRGVGGSAWMPSERRCPWMARRRVPAPRYRKAEPLRYRADASAEVWLLLAPKVTLPSGRNLTQQHPDAVLKLDSRRNALIF